MPRAWCASLVPRAVLTLWFTVVVVVCASLLARHLVALPRPTYSRELSAALGAFRPAESAGSLGVVHILYSECRCSRLIAEHLASKPRPAGVIEHVVLVGRDDVLAARLSSRGFLVQLVSEEELATWGIEAAPIFVVIAPSGEIRYAGGYTERKQALFPRDREIVAALRAGEDVVPLPLFGCAVSEKLKRTINPFDLP